MKNTQATYPEINALNLRDVEAALKLASVNFDLLTPDAARATLPRIYALQDRRRRLLATDRRIRAARRAK